MLIPNGNSILETRILVPCRQCGDLDYEGEMQDNFCICCWEFPAEEDEEMD